MNLLLFEREELNAAGELVLRDRRLRHLQTVLGSEEGDDLRVGEVNGAWGTGTVLELQAHEAILKLTLDKAPPPPLPLTVVLALPRPKMLRRILRTLAEAGVKDLHLINSFRVEKSYWQTPLLQAGALREALLAGLEQAVDTMLPRVALHQRFRPFAEDLLPALSKDRCALLADPRATEAYPPRPAAPSLLLVGPEGGFIPFERELIIDAGARPVSLGSRVLRTETALFAALGRHLANTF